MSDGYKISSDGNGTITAVVDAAGNDVLADADRPEYHRFLEWASRQPHDGLPKQLRKLMPRTVVLASVEATVEFLKENSIVLKVEDRDGSLIIPRELIMIGHSTNEITMVVIPRATAAEEGNCDSFAVRGVRFSQERTQAMVSRSVLKLLEAELNNESSQLRMLSSWPVSRTFVYVDISDFSQSDPAEQLIIINQLGRTVHGDDGWFGPGDFARASIETSICTGDGYVFVFSEPSSAVFFAAYLACRIEQLVASKADVEYHFRIGVHTGPVFRFWEKTWNGPGKWNYTGAGINDARRVLEAIGRDQDDVVFVSSETRAAMITTMQSGDFSGGVKRLHNRGRRRDKHGGMRRLYELNHIDWAMNHLAGTVFR